MNCGICRDVFKSGCVFCNPALNGDAFNFDNLDPQPRKFFSWETTKEKKPMGVVVKFPKHLFSRTCLNDGLRHCITCAGAEGSLPTHCPQSRMSMDTEDAVAAGELDFINGEWVAAARKVGG
jgi:hypothetical protein